MYNYLGKHTRSVQNYLAELLNSLEQRRLMRQDGMVEGALVANHKTQSKGKYLNNYPPYQHCGKNGHPPYKCWKRPAQCKICNQYLDD